MKESLHNSEHLLKTLTDFMPGMVGYWTKDLRSVFANREYLKWLGKSLEEMEGIHIQDLLGEELFGKSEPYIRAALAGEVQKFEWTLARHDGETPEGETRDTLVYYIPCFDNGDVAGFFALTMDITERKHLEQALVSVAEEHQRSIGQELHDNLGQQIAAIGYQAKALEKIISASGNADAAGIAASIAAQAQNAVMQCKCLAQGLLTFNLEDNGLVAALQEFTAGIAITYGVTCDFVCDSEVAIDDANLALNLYRIAQEASHNAIRHGHAQHLVISLASENGALRFSVADDGCGFADTDTKHGTALGMGIKIMQYRARQLGATLEFLSRAEGGTEVRVEMNKTQPC
ncbi:MAG: PAS domain-containing protein [Sulfuricellaceae bacterium]